MENQTLPKASRWEGKVSTRVAHASPEQIWPYFSDFFGLHRWFPDLSTCIGISGQNGEIGCVRFCKGSFKSKDGARTLDIWAKQRLIEIDHVGRSLSYEIFENNKGFNSYVATMKVVRSDEHHGKIGCLVEWVFSVDPIDGWELDELVESYELWLQCMAKKMEDDAIPM